MSEPELTPQQDEQVRRLLAEARHDAPIPDDVAARLDDVLAGLTPDDLDDLDDAPSEPPAAPVVDLAARRRRRNASVLLGAAAAAIIGVFGVSQVIEAGGSGDDAGGGGGTAADAPANRQSESGAAADADGSDDSAGTAEEESQLAAGEPLELSSRSLGRDVESQLDEAASPAVPDAAANAAPQEASPCATSAPTAYGVGDFYAAVYDGIPALLVLRPAEGDRQRADVLDCATAEQLDSVEVPAQGP